MDTQLMFDAVADATRRRILALLVKQGELCVCELTSALDDIQPKVSRHLGVLKEAGVVLARREGTWMFYRLEPSLPAWAATLLATLPEGATPEFKGDLKRLKGGTHFGEAVHFFFYDTPKVLLLLTGIVFLMGIVQTFFSPGTHAGAALRQARRRRQRHGGDLGIVTPFCSCSAVPLFIGFLSAGVPLGVTFSFLISAPMVNEVALALLFGMFGWKVAALYLGLGLLVAIVAGW
jgi:uncharacterized membrane protein YraQ (UPF0718 family)